MSKLIQEFLSFSELASHLGCADHYLHHLISIGKIIPAVRLSDRERYPGGEFREPYDLGEGVQFGVHIDYDEIYGNENQGENWPQCAPVVFCHFPSHDVPNDYSFDIFCENSNAAAADVFFFSGGENLIKDKSDGEGRFRFYWPEIARLTLEDTNTERQTNTPPEIPGKLPRIGVGKLAVKAAWKLEIESNPILPATAKDVMSLLQRWADSGKEPDTLRKSNKDKRGVTWITSKCVEKLYAIEACEKTLATWRNSRK